MKQVIDHDPNTGISHVLYFDEGTQEARYVAEQDVTGTLDLNRKQANEVGKRFGGEAMHHVARIPNVILLDLKKQGILDDWPRFKRWLNDPDNRFFRTHEGSL